MYLSELYGRIGQILQEHGDMRVQRCRSLKIDGIIGTNLSNFIDFSSNDFGILEDYIQRQIDKNQFETRLVKNTLLLILPLIDMFTTKCFIRKNTPELRDKLKRLGYRVCSCCESKDNIWLNNFLTIKNDSSIHGIGVWDIEDSQEKALNLYVTKNAKSSNPAIDCGENVDLFLALAALRDDKPDYQWFVWDDNENEGEKFKQYIPGEPWQDWWWFEVHKATVNELLEHFKD